MDADRRACEHRHGQGQEDAPRPVNRARSSAVDAAVAARRERKRESAERGDHEEAGPDGVNPTAKEVKTKVVGTHRHPGTAAGPRGPHPHHRPGHRWPQPDVRPEPRGPWPIPPTGAARRASAPPGRRGRGRGREPDGRRPEHARWITVGARYPCERGWEWLTRLWWRRAPGGRRSPSPSSALQRPESRARRSAGGLRPRGRRRPRRGRGRRCGSRSELLRGTRPRHVRRRRDVARFLSRTGARTALARDDGQDGDRRDHGHCIGGGVRSRPSASARLPDRPRPDRSAL